MAELLHQRIRALLDADASATLSGIRRGLEKESLRITPDGHLAHTPHPQALGSALTHPYITTDFSEALLEFVTPPSTDLHQPLAFLDDLHRFVYNNIGDEILWVNSMPCLMGSDDDIPLADYGTTNVGWMKHIYRRGLGYRYGRAMQTIAGIHYNFSLPAEFWRLHQLLERDQRPLQSYISARYLDLLRNFQRYSWLLLLLFGASPAICPSFMQGRSHDRLQSLGKSLYTPFATSLRMSDIGYQNKAQSAVELDYNDLDGYVESLTRMINTPDPAYEQIGVKVDGEYRQLNANILQIENEYYSSARPKRSIERGERPTLALQRRGVEYIEMRALDLNPFEPVGISERDLRFLDLFAVWCLLQASPPLDDTDLQASRDNLRAVAYDGRNPGLTINRRGQAVNLHDWARRQLEDMQPIAELFDGLLGNGEYRAVLAEQRERVEHPETTPSAQVLAEMERRNQSFFGFAMEQALAHRDHFLSRPLDPTKEHQFEQLAACSLEQQRAREEQPEKSFEDYLEEYFA
jgi:glutamate--cysteine ligase